MSDVKNLRWRIWYGRHKYWNNHSLLWALLYCGFFGSM